MRLIRPLPRAWTRPLTLALFAAWVVQMGLLLRESYASGGPALAADLAAYGTTAQWRGIYYQDEKIGFTVSQTIPGDDGYELHEDGQIRMNLLGVTASARHRIRARVDRNFRLRSFSFSLDPGSSPVSIEGTVSGSELELVFSTTSGVRRETRTLEAAPQLPINLPRRLAAEGLEPGMERQVQVFDPATLREARMRVAVGERELARLPGRSVPAFRVETEFAGVRVTSWVTETGDVIREESPSGLVAIREHRDRALELGEPADLGFDVLEASAVVPAGSARIVEPAAVRRLRLRLEGTRLDEEAMQGVGQTLRGNVLEIADPRSLEPGPPDPAAASFLEPEPLIESDDPAIRAEAAGAVEGSGDDRDRAERLVRHVHARLDKRPTISLPSAREVLEAQVGDCNEHTALYVAMARAIGLPARTAVGLVHLRGAFYYHAWPEVYLEPERGRGLWLPVDPTLNQFPADATHVRLLRGGLDRQAEIASYINQLRLTILDLEEEAQANPILVGAPGDDAAAVLTLPIELPERSGGESCWGRGGP